MTLMLMTMTHTGDSIERYDIQLSDTQVTLYGSMLHWTKWRTDDWVVIMWHWTLWHGVVWYQNRLLNLSKHLMCKLIIKSTLMKGVKETVEVNNTISKWHCSIVTSDSDWFDSELCDKCAVEGNHHSPLWSRGEK